MESILFSVGVKPNVLGNALSVIGRKFKESRNLILADIHGHDFGAVEDQL